MLLIDFNFCISDPEAPRCFGIYGCFPITGPFGGDTRPISNYPETPMKINTRYAVYTKHNRHLPKYLSLNESAETKFSGINPKGNIYVIAHGYLDSGDRPWVLELMNALLDRDRTGIASVITVDWSGGASPPYTQAVANIRLVGVITAHVLFMIYEQFKMKNLDNIHMVIFSSNLLFTSLKRKSIFCAVFNCFLHPFLYRLVTHLVRICKYYTHFFKSKHQLYWTK